MVHNLTIGDLLQLERNKSRLSQGKQDEAAGDAEENLEDLNCLYESHMEKNYQKGRAALLTSSSNTSQQQHSRPFTATVQPNRTFASKGISTSTAHLASTQSVHALHSQISNLEPTDLTQVREMMNIVHRSPIRTGTRALMDDLTMQLKASKSGSRKKI